MTSQPTEPNVSAVRDAARPRSSAGPPSRPNWTAEPSSRQGLPVVLDIAAARAELPGRGVEVGEVRHIADGTVLPGCSATTVCSRCCGSLTTR